MFISRRRGQPHLPELPDTRRTGPTCVSNMWLNPDRAISDNNGRPSYLVLRFLCPHLPRGTQRSSSCLPHDALPKCVGVPSDRRLISLKLGAQRSIPSAGSFCHSCVKSNPHSHLCVSTGHQIYHLYYEFWVVSQLGETVSIRTSCTR